MESKTPSNNVLYEVVTSAESTEQEGLIDGIRAGERLGLIEGYKLGWDKGASIGSELGFYQGFAEMTLNKMKANKNFKERTKKSLLNLLSMIEAFPLTEPTDEQLFKHLEMIRSKFKQITSVLGISARFGDTSKAVMSF